MEPVLDASSNMPLATLTDAVGKSLQSWNQGQLPALEEAR
jgi:hypothetical protein